MSEAEINEINENNGDYIYVASNYDLAITINTEEDTEYTYDRDAVYES